MATILGLRCAEARTGGVDRSMEKEVAESQPRRSVDQSSKCDLTGCCEVMSPAESSRSKTVKASSSRATRKRDPLKLNTVSL